MFGDEKVYLMACPHQDSLHMLTYASMTNIVDQKDDRGMGAYKSDSFLINGFLLLNAGKNSREFPKDDMNDWVVDCIVNSPTLEEQIKKDMKSMNNDDLQFMITLIASMLNYQLHGNVSYNLYDDYPTDQMKIKARNMRKRKEEAEYNKAVISFYEKKKAFLSDYVKNIKVDSLKEKCENEYYPELLKKTRKTQISIFLLHKKIMSNPPTTNDFVTYRIPFFVGGSNISQERTEAEKNKYPVGKLIPITHYISTGLMLETDAITGDRQILYKIKVPRGYPVLPMFREEAGNSLEGSEVVLSYTADPTGNTFTHGFKVESHTQNPYIKTCGGFGEFKGTLITLKIERLPVPIKLKYYNSAVFKDMQ